MEIWIATSNKGKLSEIKMALEGLAGVSVHSQGELSSFYPRPETGKTFEENARIKAETLHSVKDQVWVLGEDSGICVEGLNGLPGVHSARYAGDKASDSENIAKLLKMMKIRALANRNAEFVCSLVAKGPKGEERVFEGKMKGRISSNVAGQLGFGYDPVFIPAGEEKTLAELGPGYKVHKSHRAIAFDLFVQYFRSI